MGYRNASRAPLPPEPRQEPLAAEGSDSPVTAPISKQVTAAPGPISTPPAPKQLPAPYNVFTASEVVAALDLLAEGLTPYTDPEVVLTWRNGSVQQRPTADLQRVSEVEQIAEVSMQWTYADGSEVSGSLLSLSDRGRLSVQGDGQALASGRACLGHLQQLRPGHAAWRAFVMRGGVHFVTSGLALLLTVVLLVSSRDDEPTQFESWGAVAAAGIMALLLALALLGVLTLVWRAVVRRIGGTRLGSPALVHRSLLTSQTSVLVTVVTLPLTLISIIIAVLALG